MHDHPAFIFAALLILLFGLVSQRAERSPLTGPMFFVLVGVLSGTAGFDLFKLSIDGGLVKFMAEITLVLILFVDGTLINRRDLAKESPKISVRLLAIGLPLCMFSGAMVAMILFPEMGLWTVVLMALILAPTDAALGQAVIKSESVPERLRRAMSVESGINDGIALAPILICIAALASAGQHFEGNGHWLYFSAQQLILGPIVGGLVGWLGGSLVEKASLRGWMQPTFQRLACLSLAVLAYSLAEMVHGNGFIAAFFGGLLLGAHSPKVRERIQEFGEAEGQLFALFIFLLFGMVLVPSAMPYWDGTVWAYAVLSLTVIRMVPVAISLIGTKLDGLSVVFLGWFGPRGIASILYLLIVVGELGVVGYKKMLSVVVLTVLLSVVLHGISAVPLSRLLSTERAR